MAVMVHHGLFVGGGYDVPRFAGSVLHCARDPWFKDAQEFRGAIFGRTSEGIKISARISYNEMALNMVDARTPDYFPDEMIDAGLNFITERMAEGDPVLVHCNQGLSRGPSMAFLWMWEHGFLENEFRYALPQYRTLYPDYSPGNGVFQYLKARCEKDLTN